MISIIPSVLSGPIASIELHTASITGVKLVVLDLISLTILSILMYMIQSMSYQLDLFFISKTYFNR